MTLALSARWRIALTHAALLGGALAVLGGVALAWFERQLYAQLDRQLGDDLDDIPRHRAPLPVDGAREDEERDPARFFALLDRAGRVRARSGAAAAALLDYPPEPGEGLGPVAPVTRRSARGSFRVAATVAWLGEGRLLVRAGRDATAVEHAVASSRRLLLGVLPAALAIALGLGHVSAATALRGVERGVEAIRRFTADAAHELRTPVAAVRALGEVSLRRSRTPEAYARTIEDMLEELARLSALVDRMLLLARADAGQLPLHPVRLDLRDLVRGAADLFGPLAEDRAVELVVDAPRAALVHADPLLLESALGNLLDNAIKATPAGGRVVVRVGAGSVAVRDSGPGVPAEHRARIFDRFYRVDAGRARSAGGAGLGLAITRWIVESHGGSISCENVPGAGAEFRVQLPEAG